jgi:tetratricopeptide (TPR) repeat protein
LGDGRYSKKVNAAGRVPEQYASRGCRRLNSKISSLLTKGYSSQKEGDLSAAEESYLEVLRHDPNNEYAHNLMGVICLRSRRYSEAVNHLTTALTVNSRDPQTHNNLGLAFKELRQFPSARKSFESSVALDASQPETLNNLGNVLAALADHEAAIRMFESALALNGKYVDCLNNLCVSLREVGRLDHALQVVDHALRVDPSCSLSHANRGEVLLQSAQYEQAHDSLSRAIQLDGNLITKLHLSTTQKQLGDTEKAKRTLLEILQTEPRNAEALSHLGVLQEQLGNAEEAAKYFRDAIKCAPRHASSWFQLSKLKNTRLTEGDITDIQSQLDDPETLDVFKSSLYFALAWEFEKRKEFETSILYFKKAQEIKARRSPYREEPADQYLKVCREVFPVSMQQQAPVSDDYPVPIFIVGMPRSGTTLTEQILSSHPRIAGAGEVGFINDISRRMESLVESPFPVAAKKITTKHREMLRKEYLSRMASRCGPADFVVDKNPLNFNFVGLITTLFPDARIIYCKRNAMDNCLSIFRLPFDENQGYSHDMRALGSYYRYHEDLMTFWKTFYGDQIFTAEYEDTVANLERAARQMLQFIGVEFDEDVLNFHDNQRVVMTPSAEQVRRPIYKTSMNVWKRYGSALDPLRDSLNRNKETDSE